MFLRFLSGIFCKISLGKFLFVRLVKFGVFSSDKIWILEAFYESGCLEDKLY